MTPQNKQLAKQIVLNLNKFGAELGNASVLIVQEILSAYEQEQPEAIVGEKTKTEIWHEWDAKPDLSYNEAAYGAMIEYASQQTSAKDKEIAELKQRISELEKLI